jgi:hypothetical protein
MIDLPFAEIILGKNGFISASKYTNEKKKKKKKKNHIFIKNTWNILVKTPPTPTFTFIT